MGARAGQSGDSIRGRIVILLAMALQTLGGCTPSNLGPASGSQPISGASTAAPSTVAEWVITGQVLDLAGNPAGDVRVTGRAAVDAAALISNNTGSLIDGRANPLLDSRGNPLMDSRGNPLLDTRGAAFRIQVEGLDTRTDANGRFTLRAPGDYPLNVEAVLSDTLKAIQLDVSSASNVPTLRLAPTSTVTGRVTAPDAPLVTDFEGVEVFIPGTSYQARTDSSGRFTLSNVPAGTFPLVALNAGLGRGFVAALRVDAGQSVAAPDVAMTLKAPVIARVSPDNGGPDSRVTLSGREFGATAGKTFLVTFNGVIATGVQRVSDDTIRVTVPRAARTGDLVVMVNGIPSNALPFQVVKRLVLSPGHQELAVGVRTAYGLEAFDTEGDPVATPSVTWRSEGEALTLSASSVEALKVGEGRLVVESGTVRDVAVLRVTVRAPRVETVAGDGEPGYQDGPGASARFNGLTGIAVASDGTTYVCSQYTPVLRAIDPDGTVRTVAGANESGLVDAATSSARFGYLTGVCVEPSGNILVSDAGNNSIRRVTPDGRVSTLAGPIVPPDPNVYSYQFVDGASSSARFSIPVGLVALPDGTVYVADMWNHRIRRIAPDGVVKTFAGNGSPTLVDGLGDFASFRYPSGLALDAEGNLIVVDQGNQVVRRISPDGLVTTLAGDAREGYADRTGREARFFNPVGLAIDPVGTLFISDLWNHRIRKMTPDGVVTTLAGGSAGFVDGTVPEARFSYPSGLALDPTTGNLLVTDAQNDRVRRIVF
jgi:sugar lactone lactonase YvrE